MMGNAVPQQGGYPTQHLPHSSYQAPASQPGFAASAAPHHPGLPPTSVSHRGDTTVSVSSVETPIISPTDETQYPGQSHQHHHMDHGSPRGPPVPPSQGAGQQRDTTRGGQQQGAGHTVPGMQPHPTPNGQGLPPAQGAYQQGYPGPYSQGGPGGYHQGGASQPPHSQGYQYPPGQSPSSQAYPTGQPHQQSHQQPYQQPQQSHQQQQQPGYATQDTSAGFYGAGPKAPGAGFGASTSQPSFPASSAQQVPAASSVTSSQAGIAGHRPPPPVPGQQYSQHRAPQAMQQQQGFPQQPEQQAFPQQQQPGQQGFSQQQQQPGQQGFSQQQQQPVQQGFPQQSGQQGYPQQQQQGFTQQQQLQPQASLQQGFQQQPSQQTQQGPKQPLQQQYQQQPQQLHGQPLQPQQQQPGAFPQASYQGSQAGALHGYAAQQPSAAIPHQQPGSFQQQPIQGPTQPYGMQHLPQSSSYQLPQFQQVSPSQSVSAQAPTSQPSWQAQPQPQPQPQGLKTPSTQAFHMPATGAAQQSFPAGSYQAQQPASGQQTYGLGGPGGTVGGTQGVPATGTMQGSQAMTGHSGVPQDASRPAGPPGQGLQGQQQGPNQPSQNLTPKDSSKPAAAAPGQQDTKSQPGFQQPTDGSAGEGMFGLPEGMMHPAFRLPQGRQQQWQGYPGYQMGFGAFPQGVSSETSPGGLPQDSAHHIQKGPTSQTPGAPNQQGQSPGFPGAMGTSASQPQQTPPQQQFGGQGFQQGALGPTQPGASVGAAQMVPRGQNTSGNAVVGPAPGVVHPGGLTPTGPGLQPMGAQFQARVMTPVPSQPQPGGVQQQPLGTQSGPYGAPVGAISPNPKLAGSLGGGSRPETPTQAPGGAQYPPGGMYGQYPQAPVHAPQGALPGPYGSPSSTLPQPLQPSANQVPPPGLTAQAPQGCPAPHGVRAAQPGMEGSHPQTLSRQSSSLDEILSSSPTSTKDTAIPAPQIEPKVLTAQEKQQQKEEALKMKGFAPEPENAYSNTAALNRFVSDVESFGIYVDALLFPQHGTTPLDALWKTLMESQEFDGKRNSIAIARCYPMKNRDPDIMPYDETRVTLSSMKDDYINASWINDLAPSCPKFISTQHPLGVTINDFWAMVYEQGSEVIVMITSEYETGKKYPGYWPTEKGKPVEHGHFLLELQSVKFRELWNERIIYMRNTETRQGRSIVHLQFKNWPVSGFPDNVSQVVRFITEVHTFYKQQRSLMKPVIVQCGNGVGRSGVFLLIYAAMQELNHGNGLVDLPSLAKRMLSKRKNMLQKREQLRYCYDAVLYYAEDYLKKRGVLVRQPHFQEQRCRPAVTEQHPQPPPDDIVLGSLDFQHLKQKVGSLGDRRPSDPSASFPASVHASAASEPSKMLTVPAPTDAVSPASSSLPDLLQQSPNKHDLDQGQGGQGHAREDAIAGGQGVPGETILPVVGDHQVRSRSGSSSSIQSTGSGSVGQGSGTGSGKPSPMHRPKNAGSMPQSLADLTNPSTFTLGSSEGGSKKVTRSNFASKKGSLMEGAPDPSDPLSSLDPLWSLKDKK